MNRIKIVELFFICLILNCCSISDNIHDLGNGYFYKGEGAPLNNIFIGARGKDLKSYTIEEIIIHPNVSHYIVTDRFLLVTQDPDYESIVQAILMEDNLTPILNETDRQQKNIYADSILQSSVYADLFKNSPNYYIIDKLKRHVSGPLTKDEFKNTSINLNISDDLVNDILDSS